MINICWSQSLFSAKNTKANRKILLVFVEGTKDDAILWVDLQKQVFTAALYKTATFIISSMPFLGQKKYVYL